MEKTNSMHGVVPTSSHNSHLLNNASLTALWVHSCFRMKCEGQPSWQAGLTMSQAEPIFASKVSIRMKMDINNCFNS